MRLLLLFGCLLKSPSGLSQKNSATGTHFSLINYLGMGILTVTVCNLFCKKAGVLDCVSLWIRSCRIRSYWCRVKYWCENRVEIENFQ